MLAFDRDRIASLTSATHNTALAVGRWAIGATALSLPDAGRNLAVVSSVLQNWTPRLAELALCDAMERHPVLVVAYGFTPGDRRSVEARLFTDVGWHVVSDGEDVGHGGVALMSDAQLISLVRRLDPGALTDLTRDVVEVADPTVLPQVAAALPALEIGAPGPTDALLRSLDDEKVSVLLVHLGTTPDAARAALAAASRLPDGADTLLWGDADPAAVRDLVARAVSDLTPATAGSILLPYTRMVLDKRVAPDHRRHLGTLIAPYLLQFTSRTGDWNLDRDEGVHLLTEILRDRGAMEELLAARERWATPASVGTTDELTTSLDELTASLDDLAGMLGIFDAIVHDEEIDDELADRAAWDLGWWAVNTGVSAAISAVPVLKGPLRTAAVGIANEALARTRRLMEDKGWIGAPGTPESIRFEAALRHDHRRASLGWATATALTDVLRANGRAVGDPPPLPTDSSCPSAEWRDEFEEWVDTLDPDDARLVHHAVSTVVNRYQTAEACYELTTT